MKNLLLTIIAITFSMAAIAGDFDVYTDAWRGDTAEPTGRLGFEYKDVSVTGSFEMESEKLSIGLNRSIKFTNVELGVQFLATYGNASEVLDYRVHAINNDLFLETKPYAKIGDKVFMTIMLDSNNEVVYRVGFNIF